MSGRKKAWLLLITSILLTTAAQLMFRAGARGAPEFDRVTDLLNRGLVDLFIATNGTVIAAGILCYAISMLCWVIAISRFDLSVAYPMLSISYALVYLLAVFLPDLAEQASAHRSIGIGLIVLGVALVGRSGKPAGDFGHDARESADS